MPEHSLFLRQLSINHTSTAVCLSGTSWLLLVEQCCMACFRTFCCEFHNVALFCLLKWNKQQLPVPEHSLLSSSLASTSGSQPSACPQHVGCSSLNKTVWPIYRASYCEIYNEALYDLLKWSKQQLQVRWDSGKGFYVPDLAVKECSSVEDMLQVLCCAVLCYAVLCCAVLCCAVPHMLQALGCPVLCCT